MLKRYLLFTIFSFALTSMAFGQLFEDFEDGSKQSYAAGNVNLPTGSWYLGDALLGSLDNDFKNGSQSIRMNHERSSGSILQMNFDFPEGVTELAFNAANYGASGDTGGIIQVYVSTDSGSSWTEVGSEITLSDSFENYSFELEESGTVRFRISTLDGARINIDDLTIEPFVELNENPSITLRRDGESLNNGDLIEFSTAGVGSSRSADVEIRNEGELDLDISSASLTEGTAFTIDSDITGSFSSRETATLTFSFSPQSVGEFSDSVTISSNDPEIPEFAFELSGSAIADGDIISISQARNLPLGTKVTVTGWATVTDEFSGPVYLQDESGGIAWFNGPLMRDGEFELEIARGDSIVLTGELGEFNEFLQVIGSENEIEYEIFPEGNRNIAPTDITISQLNSGDFEGQLIRISDFQLNHSGTFQGGTNYIIADQTGEGELRIDPQSNVPGSQVPEQPMAAVGVAGHFNGIEQIIPRDTDDLNVDPFINPGDDVPKDQTFDVVTWNIEWFGSSGNGPDDTDLQLANVITVVETIDADLYALQEISSQARFNDLVDSLDNYSGFWADYSSQTQNTAYLFKPSVIDSVDSGLLEAGQQEFDWAFRLPLFFEFDATVEGVTRRIHSYNVHAKALADQDSYDRRTTASLRLKIYLDNNRQNENVLFLGDYNDKLFSSTYNNETSPYDNFVQDESYFELTGELEQRGLNSFIAGQNQSMIDHITVTNDLIEDHINGAQRVENPNYIGSYISTTSDHAPVWTRFDFTRNLVSVDETFDTEQPKRAELDQNYPNPFNPATNISFTLPERSEVSLRVYDVTGRQVATLANSQSFTGGSHTLTFDASNLASGMYIYRLTLNNGVALTRKMMIVK